MHLGLAQGPWLVEPLAVQVQDLIGADDQGAGVALRYLDGLGLRQESGDDGGILVPVAGLDFGFAESGRIADVIDSRPLEDAGSDDAGRGKDDRGGQESSS